MRVLPMSRGIMLAFVIANLLTLGRSSLGLSADTPEPIVLKGHTNEVTTIAWATDGKTVATAGDDRTIRIWEPATGKLVKSLDHVAREGFGSPVVAFTSDLKLAAVNYWGEITILELPSGQVNRTIDPLIDRGQPFVFRPDVYALAFSPDGKRLLAGSAIAATGGRHGLPGGVVCVYDVATGKRVFQSDKLSTAGSSVAWSRDGKRFAAGTSGAGGELPESGELHVWSSETGKVIRSIKVKPEVAQGEWASVADVALNPTGTQIVAPITAGSRGTPAGLLIDEAGAAIGVWDIESGEGKQPISGLRQSIVRLQFADAGKSLAAAGTDRAVRVWDAESGEQRFVTRFKDHVTAFAMSPDGQLIAVATKDGDVHIRPIAK